MTYLPATVAGRWFHLYLILDLFSRKVVGWEVHDSDDADHAAHLVRRTALAEDIATLQSKPVLHGDNGATLKATTVLAMLHWLGVKPSYSRPRVSDDNAYAESLFRTAKYRTEFPARGFDDLDAARAWAAAFVRCYNLEHRHSGIRSPPRSGMQARITPSWRLDTRSTPKPASATRPGGLATHAVGRPLARTPSIPSATPSSAPQRLARKYGQWLHDRGDNYLDARRLVTGHSSAHAVTRAAPTPPVTRPFRAD